MSEHPTAYELLDRFNAIEREGKTMGEKGTNLKVGQKVWSLNVGNAARRCPQVLTPCIITNIGRKYFSVRREHDKTGWTETKYLLGNMAEVTEYSPNSEIYLSEQEWEEQKLEREICKNIEDAFKYGHNKKNLSLDVLKRINCLLSCE